MDGDRPDLTRRMKAKHLVLPIALTVCAAVALVTLPNASAQNVPGYPENVLAFDSREIAMLPKYCIYSPVFRERVPGGNNRAEIEKWQTLMGKAFESIHHYCWGLMKLNRANLLARDQQTRLFYWGDAVREFDYVLQYAPDDFALKPELLTKKGEALFRLGKGPQGVIELEQAIQSKPDYWPAYIMLSNHYENAGDLAKARETLQIALSHAPEAVTLKKRLTELNDKISKRKSAPANRN